MWHEITKFSCRLEEIEPMSCCLPTCAMFINVWHFLCRPISQGCSDKMKKYWKIEKHGTVNRLEHCFHYKSLQQDTVVGVLDCSGIYISLFWKVLIQFPCQNVLNVCKMSWFFCCEPIRIEAQLSWKQRWCRLESAGHMARQGMGGTSTTDAFRCFPLLPSNISGHSLLRIFFYAFFFLHSSLLPQRCWR